METERSDFEYQESHEKDRGRHFDVLMVRHAKQSKYESQTDTRLSPEGEKQAEVFARELLKQYEGKQVLFKIKHSGIDRATQTAVIIEQTLENLIKQQSLQNFKILKTRHNESLNTTGALGPLLNSGIVYEKAVDEWLADADKYEGARTPEEISAAISEYVDHTNRLVKKLSDEGDDIVLIWITHETAHAALMNSHTNKNTAELGGSIEHLEALKVSFSKDSTPIAQFRGKQFEIETK